MSMALRQLSCNRGKARKHPDLVKDIADRGHVIGVHGHEHKVLQASLLLDRLHSDLQLAQKSVIDSSGQTIIFVQAPRVEHWMKFR